MIDIEQTRAALERAIGHIEFLGGEWPADFPQCDADAAILRALSAALGQAQPAWQTPNAIGWQNRPHKPAGNARRVLILPLDAADKETT